MHGRPERPLLVKCTFDRWNKRISFASARNCSYDLLRNRIEQCFSLYATPYAISYRDDDGEVTDITTEADLTEAIQYFQAGSDDPPLSSAASILSGRSFGSKRITLRVLITVDYDGPSLSDTSSLASLDEYRGRNEGDNELNWPSASGDGGAGEIDDDSVTVSSRDTTTGRFGNAAFQGDATTIHNRHTDRRGPFSIPEAGEDDDKVSTNPPDDTGPFADHYIVSDANEDAENVFETHIVAPSDCPQSRTISSFNKTLNLSAQDRGAAWLRDQNARIIRSMLGATPEPSDVDTNSISMSFSEQQLQEGQMDGGLALQRDQRGKYYYSYTVGDSTTHHSGYEDGSSCKDGLEPCGGSLSGNIRPSSMQLSWLASQKKLSDEPNAGGSISDSHSYDTTDIPCETLASTSTSPPPGSLTTCSECGVFLDAIRYVCATCGEKEPTSCFPGPSKMSPGSCHAMGRDFPPVYTYPPPSHLTPQLSSSPSLLDAQTLVSFGHTQSEQHKPLPPLPGASTPTLHGSVSRSVCEDVGYELCSGCIENAGIYHALQESTERMDNIGLEPTSAEAALSLWRRSAPRHKGQLRHAYFEKVWGPRGWEDVEQEDMHMCKCSTCNSTISIKRFKCASCKKFNLCRACYSQVHDIHPTHSFLIVRGKCTPSRTELSALPSAFVLSSNNEEISMKHPGVKCAHCLQDIVGARFHCVICNSVDVDICSNCESAGLPGNLDSADGGHNSSHIMIKIPYPLESSEVQTASRHAIHLWTGRDAAQVLRTCHSKPSSVYSSYAQTVVGSRIQLNLDDAPKDHHVNCNGCNETIFGIRYQCATCPSSPAAYSLCASCEERSYLLHDPMHSFFKLPRPVQRPLESTSPFLPKLYKVPAGPLGVVAPNTDPKEYLSFLLHSAAWCDRCMERIPGAWFHCAFCPKDLCEDCEALDTHDETHVFVVFKAPVDIPRFRQFANLENPSASPPIIPFPVYF